MNDAADLARAAAARLEGKLGRDVTPEVEAALLARGGESARDQYAIDPISLGSLIVSVASLAWTIYQDRKVKRADALERQVRVELRFEGTELGPHGDWVIETVVATVAGEDPAD